MFVGATGKEVEKMSECLSKETQIQMETLEANIDKAVYELQKQTFDGVASGVKELGYAMEQIPNIIAKCPYVTRDDISQLQKMANLFIRPVTLGYLIEGIDSILVNEVEIFEALNTSLTFYASEKYQNFGL